MNYADHPNLLELVALMERYAIRHVVISPGSRNAPLAHTFAAHPAFECHSVVDERSAGFVALGMAMKLQEPVALCCTSGSALLNYGPALAEAYYQELPLLLISADRPKAWIGQGDGQTLPQGELFARITRKSVELPAFNNAEERWHGNRLINEALIALTREGFGPAHINIPLGEPLYSFNTSELPEVRRIRIQPMRQQLADSAPLKHDWEASSKRWLLVGQMPPDGELCDAIRSFATRNDCLVVGEQSSNLPNDVALLNLDALLYTLSDEEQQELAPELLICAGGHLVSKRIREYLRKHPPKQQWSLTLREEIVDPYGAMSDQIAMELIPFLASLSEQLAPTQERPYALRWEAASKRLAVCGEWVLQGVPYSDLAVMRDFVARLPKGAQLHLANSSPIRNAQLCSLPRGTTVYANRGVSGIDGTLSTAVGFAALTAGETYLVIGDLSFFYDLNGLWNGLVPAGLRILLINNSGGGIFRFLPGANQSEALEPFIAAHHTSSARGWAESRGIRYFSAHNGEELRERLEPFYAPSECPILIEVMTPPEVNPQTFKTYFQQLKKTRTTWI